jgi:hypothetical protein
MMRDRDLARSSLLGRVVALLLALPVLTLACADSAFAQGQPSGPVPAPPTTSPSAETLKNWGNGMVKVPPPAVAAPNGGCFTATYPNVQWQEVPCAQGVTVPPFPPVPGRTPSAGEAFTVGGGVDPTPGVTSGSISTAVGSFDSVSGVTSITGEFGADDYSLQLNSHTFSSPVCSGAGTPAECVGWQQFVFSNLGCNNGTVPCTFMQYWLIHWGSTTCPASGGWMFFNNGGDDECYTNSSILATPQQTIANLGNLSVTGMAVSGGLDTLVASTGATLYAVQNSDSQLGLAGNWTAIEYNIVGDGNGTESTFNPGASLVVRASVDNGTTSAPTCVSASFEGYTAETNNLYLQPASGTPRSSTQPAIVWTQNSTVSSTAPCSAGVSVPAASKLTDTHDLNGDGLSDIVWRSDTGDVAVWLMNGVQVELSATAGSAPSNWNIVGQRDFNGDGTYDLLWRDTSGDTSIWFMTGTQVFSSAAVGNVGTTWSVAGTADFNNDGKGDLLWRDSSGNTAIWLMNGASVLSTGSLGNVPTTWAVVGTGDFNGDGFADILWRDSSGNTSIWFMNGTTVSSTAAVGNIPTNWSVIGTGDFNGDGKTDIAWRDTAGDTSIWLMNGASVLSSAGIGNVPTATWPLVLTGDFNGDGKSDLLWRDTSGDTAIWFMNGTTVASSQSVGNISTNWIVQLDNAE